MQPIGNKIRNRMAVLLTLIILAGVSMYVFATAARTQEILIRRAQLARTSLERLFSDLKDAEMGTQRFLLTGEAGYLQLYTGALGEMSKELAQLTQLTADNAHAQRTIEQIRPLIDRKLAQLEQTIDLRRSKGPEATTAAAQTLQGQIMDSIRVLVDDMRREEERLIVEDDARFTTDTNRFFSALAFGGLLVAFLGVSSYRSVRDYSARTELAERRLFLLNADLERRVRERTQALQAREELLTTFVRYVPAAVAMFDREMRYLQVSDRWCTDYRLDGAQVLGRSHYEILPDIPERWKEIHRRALAGETLRAEEDLFERADGRRMWLRWEIRPWGDREGRPEGILIFSEDITQRKEMEDALQEQRNRLDKIVATAPGAICAFRLRPDGSTSLPYASPGFQKILPGLPDLKSDAEPLFAAMHPDDVERVRVSVAESARTMTPWREHFRVLTHARGAIWVEGRSVPEREPDGSTCWHGFISDITESKRMEEALRESEATTRTLFDTASQAIVGVGIDGAIQLVNQMAEQMFGYERRELLGEQVEKLLPEHLQRAHVAHRDSFTSKPGNRPMGAGLNLRGRRKDGSEFPIEASLSHVETGRGLLAVSFLTDITIRKQAELALQNSERELRELAGSLLTAHEDERRRIARDLHDNITQELAILSIEIGRLAMDTSTAEAETKKRLRSLESRVIRITNDVRAVSHGLHPSIIEDLGLSVALRAFFEEFSSAHRIPVRFEAAIDHRELSLENASCLYRIGQECVQNAAKHARATEIRATLKKTGDYVELTVNDNGVGFAAEPDRGKTGLGIVSMKERVRAARGMLSIVSRPGEGTEIRASVPVSGANHASDAHSAA